MPPPETAAAVGSVPPETAQSASGEPETVQFPAVTLEATEPVADPAPQVAQPEPAQPESAQPEPAQPEPAQPVRPEPAQSEPALPESVQSVSDQSEPAQPESVQSVTDQPEPAQPESVQSVTDQPEPAQPESAQSVTGQPQASEPVTEQFPAVPAGTSEPGSSPESLAAASRPEPVAVPAAAVPAAAVPAAAAPAAAAPAAAAPAAAASQPAAPSEPANPAPVAAVRSRAAAQPHVRVDARLLEAALLNLRKRIAAIPLVFQISGSAEVEAERGKLLSQIDDYLLPRMRRSAAPVLVALVGSTGAGKSTLVNSIVGAHVSATGVRRPTTNSPVLACHPDEIDWFAENNFLPTLPRVRQEGLARPGRDGLLVLAASEGMPRGIALLDTPDIDSVVQAHHEFAYQFLDASDLWLFMTSASRYADGPVWEILQHARDRKASLGVVMSRIPQAYRTELVDHFNAMLDANGIAAADRFVIPEIPLTDGMLPADAYQPIRDWLADTAGRADRRVAVLSQNDVRCARHVQDQNPGHSRARRGASRAARRTAGGRRDGIRERLR